MPNGDIKSLQISVIIFYLFGEEKESKKEENEKRRRIGRGNMK